MWEGTQDTPVLLCGLYKRIDICCSGDVRPLWHHSQSCLGRASYSFGHISIRPSRQSTAIVI
jgi:hypothetical protein